MDINILFDSSVQQAPAGFTQAIDDAAQFLDQTFSTPITANIEVGYGEDAGQSLGLGEDGVGGPSNGMVLSYAQLRTDMAQNATTPDAIAAVDSLPRQNPTGAGAFYVSSAEEKALGLLPADASAVDGSVGFSATENFDLYPGSRAIPGAVDLVGSAEHELTHALGRIATLGTYDGLYTPLDLFRFSGPGTPQLQPGQPGYFSIDGGHTNLENFDTTSDYGDWAGSSGNDANDAVASYGTPMTFSGTDVTEMAALGFDSPAVHDRTLNGAGGPKAFTFGHHPGNVWINDFQFIGPKHDTVTLPNSEFANMAGVIASTWMSNGNAVIHFNDPNSSVTLHGVTLAEVRAHPQAFLFGA